MPKKSTKKSTKKTTKKPRIKGIEAYTHDDVKRKNNPPAGMARHDTAPETRKTYAFDPHLDPTLDWAGKKEGLSFEVPTSSIHIHESIKPHKIIHSVQNEVAEEKQQQFFETDVQRLKRRREAIEFYQHGIDWTNRLIAGDSLVVMNSLLEKEGMAGQVQMVYIDPPYGIKYGSNFQPFVHKRDVKDGKDEDLTQEPEMVKAFRDTWELGIHSYLTYLRNRLLLARELLADTGSVFVQISERNVHHIRELCDEIFGADNFLSQISYYTTSGVASGSLNRGCDYICWYAKNASQKKYRQIYLLKASPFDDPSSKYDQVELTNGTRRPLSKEEKIGETAIPKGARVFRYDNLVSTRPIGEGDLKKFEFEGKVFTPGTGTFKTTEKGLLMLSEKKRLNATENKLNYVRYFDDFPVQQINNVWTDIGGTVQSRSDPKVYAVQTGVPVVARCMLMSTSPGDLVLDITCGSGTTAYVAEQWGRRWITCDTSRVAIALAKKRLMTAFYKYYKLVDEDRGVSGDFVYKTVPHVTLKSIANNEKPAKEMLYDQPEIDKTKVRVSGPFTVEALPAPVGGAIKGAVNAMPIDDAIAHTEDYSAKQTDWRDELLATGIIGQGGNKIEFSRVEPMRGTQYLHAEAETKEKTPRRAVVCFAGETKPMDGRIVKLALDEAEKQRPVPEIIVFAAFQFDPEAANEIAETNWKGVTLLKAQMNTDLMTEDLKKNRASNQSFWLVGQPDVELGARKFCRHYFAYFQYSSHCSV